MRCIFLKVGSETEIYLIEMSSSGYLWALHELDRNLVDMRELPNLPCQDDGVGNVNKRVFVVMAKKAGTTRMHMVRPWNGEIEDSVEFKCID